jgi:enoyl-CoA hydratase/carnithine racemase
MSDHVLVTDEGTIRIIRINRPEKKNALTLPMYERMTQALRESDDDSNCRCLVFTGAPGAFTAGNDIGEFVRMSEGGDAAPLLDFLEALAGCETPMIAAVGGIAVGIGTTMLLHCDHVIAASDATFSTPFLRLGLVPEAASTLLAPLRMGHVRAFSLLVMGRPFSAAEAKEAGIVNTVVDPAELDAAARKAANEIAALPPNVVRLTRRLMRRHHRDDVASRLQAEALDFTELLQSAEARAAFQVFLARKK